MLRARQQSLADSRRALQGPELVAQARQHFGRPPPHIAAAAAAAAPNATAGAAVALLLLLLVLVLALKPPLLRRPRTLGAREEVGRASRG